jgi:hypothetical protein
LHCQGIWNVGVASGVIGQEIFLNILVKVTLNKMTEWNWRLIFFFEPMLKTSTVHLQAMRIVKRFNRRRLEWVNFDGADGSFWFCRSPGGLTVC